MLLAVDIGNSNIKFGLFNNELLLSKVFIPADAELTSQSLTSLLGHRSITNAIVCSVVPDKEAELKVSLQEAYGLDPIIVTNDLDFGLKINYEPTSSLGTDRLVNSFAAVEKYGAPCIVCSLGTATTFDIVNGDRTFVGGIIAPGLKTMARALHLHTAMLPEVDIEKPAGLVGNSTLDSVRSGVFYGQLGMVEWTIHKLLKQAGPEAKVVATGGFASLIAENTTIIDTVDENLLLDGLRLLDDRLQSA